MASAHPCQKCGACCASFRVGFYWREAEPDEHENAVPAEFWDELTDVRRCMKGTDSKHKPQCKALEGRVGKEVNCTIYSNRPSTCRQFSASFEDGTRNEKCDIARGKHGLKPLSSKDWL
jgi:Fe-S-cluster containining protein